MSAQDFLSAVSQLIYLALFVIATIRLVRHPAWATLDTFAFFAIIAGILFAGDVARLLGFSGHPALNVLNWIGVSALPYILLRLADDFRPQPIPVMVAATISFAVVVVIGVFASQPWVLAVNLIPVAYAVVLGTYATLVFLREARRSVGVTRRRMQAVGLGSGLLVAALLLAGVRLAIPSLQDSVGLLTQLIGLGVVTSYFTGFAPPATLRRAWQEPALRALLAEAADLTRLRDVWAIIDRIQHRVTEITGADGTSIGLWDEAGGVLSFQLPGGEVRTQSPGEWIGGRAFVRQKVVFTGNAERDAPEHAAEYRASGVHAIVAAPITADERHIGVLIVYAARPPLFTDDVVALVEMMAEQAALVLRGNELLREAAGVRAMAEVTRLKDDFLSVVAHDVRTPLTTILLNAELLQQSVIEGSPEARRAASLRAEAVRLKELVEDYLDVVRAEQERELQLEQHDLVQVVRETVAGLDDETVGRVRLEGEPPAMCAIDRRRIGQLIQNLLANALKYSDSGEAVEMVVSTDEDALLLAITDHGIGIPEADLPLLFERFHRGSNTDDRRYGGLGLGLYICRQIAEEHGGNITVSSRVGSGTTFTVRLPREPLKALAAS